MLHSADSEVASVTVVAVTSAAEAATPSLDKESLNKRDVEDSRKHHRLVSM